MANFLPIIPCHLYIVTDSESASEVERLRADFPNETKVIVKSFSDLIEAKRMTMWVEQTQLDHEKHHTPELYVIWNEKVHLLMEAIEENPFDSDYFLWTDIGCFRDAERAEKLTSYPDTYTTSSLLGTNNVFFLQVGNFRQEHQIIGENGLPINHFQYDVCLGGGVFGGHANAVRQYSQQYYKTMDLMQSNGIFIGKDQNVMSTVAVLYPNLVKLVKPQYYLDGADPWFYSLHYFSKRTINETIPG
ncbi:hypothetical protein BV898_18387 [Hypsibius exemplaris]|uniref:Glycosyltransferase n=1 Tax=Hypsibius exemplaris TaxID=2072580 RepID=A0A9X6NQ61_HYPEX|nr:hypothetical protein BV898_18387 [Hypsibius exemplaris]